MKKFVLIAVAMLTVLVTSCSKGYDQAKVDNIDKESPDFKVMIEQANYALDDVENAPDLEKWVKENEKEAESLLGLCLAVSLVENELPDNLKEDAQKLAKRYEKIGDKLVPFMFGKDGAEQTNDDAPDFTEDDDNDLNNSNEPVEVAESYSDEVE